MLTLEMAIEKIQQFPPEQRNKVIEFIEFLDFQSSRQQVADSTIDTHQSQGFFELAGLWKDRNVTTESIRAEAWGEDD